MDKTDYSVLIIFLFLYTFIIVCSQCPFINTVRFLVICLCLIPALRYGVPMAALFTILSDSILLFTPHEKIGVFCFCLVQLFYIFFFLNKKPPLSIFFFSLYFLIFPLFVLGAIYALLFFLHFYIAFSLWKQKKAKPFFELYLLGLFLFVCCDTLVAIGHFTAPQPLLIWMFYAPSQLLLAFTPKALPPLLKPLVPYP